MSSNPAGGHGCLSVVSVVYCQVEVSATSWSLVQRSPTQCGMSECAIRNLMNEEAVARFGPKHQKKKMYKYIGYLVLDWSHLDWNSVCWRNFANALVICR